MMGSGIQTTAGNNHSSGIPATVVAASAGLKRNATLATTTSPKNMAAKFIPSRSCTHQSPHRDLGRLRIGGMTPRVEQYLLDTGHTRWHIHGDTTGTHGPDSFGNL